MLSIIKKIKSGALSKFHGGVHPTENKLQTKFKKPLVAPIANELVLPLKQHLGSKCTSIVNIGDKVLKGQTLSHSNSYKNVPIHAPTSGTIKAIEERIISHPSGLKDLAIIIEPDHKDTWCPLNKLNDFSKLNPQELIDIIYKSGIVGLGGAGFSTASKIISSLNKVELLIINGAECEPYVTSDDLLIQTKAKEIIKGIEILSHILKPKLVIIAIEDNKPLSIKALTKECNLDNTIIRAIPTLYPSGGKKQLIKILTGKETPAKGRSSDTGVFINNISTVYAIKRAVLDGEPLISRLVTLTGNKILKPGNYWSLIGTPIKHLLDIAKYKNINQIDNIIIGGSMMGYNLHSFNEPIIKTTNVIIAPSKNELPARELERACIRCGKCAEVCPSSLLPHQLVWYAKSNNLTKCNELNILDCIECGSCAFTCPSNIPLVMYIRQAKAAIYTEKKQTLKAKRTKERVIAKKTRIEKLKQKALDAKIRTKEKKAFKLGNDKIILTPLKKDFPTGVNLNSKKQVAKAKQQTSQNPAVSAAIARAKAKQQTSQNPAVSAAIAKAKAKQQTSQNPAVSAAIARAKAKQQTSQNPAVSAAIARAKAKQQNKKNKQNKE